MKNIHWKLRRLRLQWRLGAGRRWRPLVLVLLGLGLVAALVPAYQHVRWRTPPATVTLVPPAPSKRVTSDTLAVGIAARNVGDYENAIRIAAETTDGEGQASAFRDELLRPLSVDFQLHYHGEEAKSAFSPAIRLDEYYLTTTVSDSCYLYIVLLSQGRATLLFPEHLSGAYNRVSTEKRRVPAQGVWLKPSSLGTDRVFLLAARWRLQPIEQLMVQENGALFEELVQRLSLEERMAPQVPGLVVGTQKISLFPPPSIRRNPTRVVAPNRSGPALFSRIEGVDR